MPFSKKPGSILNVKVVQATMRRQANGKLEFTSTGQAFIDVTDSTANVHYITNIVQKKWGAEFQLVTADGLQLEDSSGTQGVYRTLQNLCNSSSLQRSVIIEFVVRHG